MTAITTIIYPVKNLSEAKTLYGALLGVDPYADAPYYVGYKVGNQDIGLDPNGHQHGMTGPVCYVNVSDLQAQLKALLDAGATLVQDVRDVGGKLIASVRDHDSNPIGLMQAL
ncbi:VOC family protein [Deinococcus roseus]|uniref:Glyoxalase n=1 Tax=Deinococcus roseus TaxID=392414 RepID=A0ABQ2CZN6_9DEIO|nr:VOC family protein [Deinococcus roseus]GGJ36480.1 glyoxalase [Deinococcus roseus]